MYSQAEYLKEKIEDALLENNINKSYNISIICNEVHIDCNEDGIIRDIVICLIDNICDIDINITDDVERYWEDTYYTRWVKVSDCGNVDYDVNVTATGSNAITYNDLVGIYY